jgi:hypothetical protein
MKLRHIASAVLVGLGIAGSMALPAHAVSLDAEGVSFNFANAGVDRLAASTTGNSYTYLNVATIGGNQIDAVVTVGDVSDALVAEEAYRYFDQATVDMINGLLPELNPDLTAGCYSNADYRQNTETYESLDFVAADRLGDGYVDAVDEFQGDSSDRGINSTVNSCTYFTEPAPATNVEITVEFEVNGNPVVLNNLLLNVQDIDGGQSVSFSSPKPTSFELTDDSELDVTEDVSSLSLTGSDIADDDPNFAAEVRFDGVSSITYVFGFPAQSGGSIGVMFDSYFDTLSEPLAPTGGQNPVVWVAPLVGIAAVLAGFVLGRNRVRQ